MSSWLTVITVVRDDPMGLNRTLASLRTQSHRDQDIVVVDSSVDHASTLASAEGLAQVLWCEPQGIYPAMNQGLEAASSDYVLYLNAGDTLHDETVLRDLSLHISQVQPAWAFGRVQVVSQDGSRVITPAWDYNEEKKHLFARGHFPPHQGTIARTELLRSIGGFDTAYRVAADYAAFLRMSREADPLVLDRVLADFNEGGTSTQHWQTSFREFHRARQEILTPRGIKAARERFDTVWHYSRVFAYREVIRRARR